MTLDIKALRLVFLRGWGRVVKKVLAEINRVIMEKPLFSSIKVLKIWHLDSKGMSLLSVISINFFMKEPCLALLCFSRVLTPFNLKIEQISLGSNVSTILRR